MTHGGAEFPCSLPPDGFDVQVSDGLGIADLAIDPYIFQVEVARLGE